MRKGWLRTRHVALAGAALALVSPAAARATEGGAAAASLSDLNAMSIEQLANLDITSVSKRGERLADAPAAVFVITHDAILQSGAVSLPEMLRLAPNLQVAEISASSYAITARGFNGNAADKLLVMIDGRSVYTQLFGGVLWDEQDVLPEDIDRIEVVSGPGATLWGANAVNGVINIITRKASDTQGGVFSASVGNRQDEGDLQYGGKAGDDLHYRAYVQGFTVPGDRTSVGTDALDAWHKTQGGFRIDWTPGRDALTLQGDIYGGAEAATPTLNEAISGGDLQLTWRRDLAAGGSIQAMA